MASDLHDNGNLLVNNIVENWMVDNILHCFILVIVFLVVVALQCNQGIIYYRIVVIE